MESLQTLKELLAHLKARKGMYVFDNSYSSLSAFLVGYLLSIRDLTSRDYSAEFGNWLQKREQKHFAAHWSSYILSELSENNAITAKEKLLNLWAEFLSENGKAESK